MNGFNKGVSEMLGRVQAFAKTHPELFETNSQTGRMFAEIETLAAKLAEEHLAQTVGTGDSRVSSADRVIARETLRGELDAITRTAKSAGIGGFWTPLDRTDKSLLEVASVFAERVHPVKDVFVRDGHMDEAFTERLTAAIAKLRDVLAKQTVTGSKRQVATLTVAKIRTEALALLTRMDPLIENQLRLNAPLLDLWWRARHVERNSGSRRRKTEPTPADANAA